MKSLLLVFTTALSLACHAATTETDLCIYGGTSAGVIAAVQMGKKVVLVEAGQHLGGMSVEGWSSTDIDSQPSQSSPAVGGVGSIRPFSGASLGTKCRSLPRLLRLRQQPAVR